MYTVPLKAHLVEWYYAFKVELLHLEEKHFGTFHNLPPDRNE